MIGSVSTHYDGIPPRKNSSKIEMTRCIANKDYFARCNNWKNFLEKKNQAFIPNLEEGER